MNSFRELCELHEAEKRAAKKRAGPKRRRPRYGPRFREYRRLVRGLYPLLRCEHCGDVAAATHHVIEPGMRGGDNPHYWIVLCAACHAMAGLCIQSFERDRLVLREED